MTFKMSSINSKEISLDLAIKEDFEMATITLTSLRNCSIELSNEAVTIKSQFSMVEFKFEFMLDVDQISRLVYSNVTSDHFQVRLPLKPSCSNIKPTLIIDVVTRCSMYEADNSKFQCRKCAHPLFTLSFTKVLPLPNEGWNDLSDTWFCHRHDHSGGGGCNGDAQPTVTAIPDQKTSTSDENSNTSQHTTKSASKKAESTNFSLLPETGECFVGRKELIMHFENADHPIAVSDDGTLTCPQCQSTIGWRPVADQAPSMIHHLYHHAVGLSPIDISPEFEVTYFSHLVLKESEDGNGYRYIIESKIGGKFRAQFLLWLIDKNACEAEARAVLKKSTDGDVVHEVVKVVPRTVMKVMYRQCVLDNGMDDEVLITWRRDFSVDSIDIPRDLARTVLRALQESTKTLQKDGRVFQDFFVGRLPR